MNKQYNPFRTNKFQQGGILQDLKDWWLGREGSEENPHRLPEVTVAYPSKEKIKKFQKLVKAPQTGIWDAATKSLYAQGKHGEEPVVENIENPGYNYYKPRHPFMKAQPYEISKPGIDYIGYSSDPNNTVFTLYGKY